MAAGFKIADAYVDIEVRLDAAKLRAELRRHFVTSSGQFRELGRTMIGRPLVAGIRRAIRQGYGDLLGALATTIIRLEPMAFRLGRQFVGEPFWNGVLSSINGAALRARVRMALAGGLGELGDLGGDTTITQNLTHHFHEAGQRAGRGFGQRFLSALGSVVTAGLKALAVTVAVQLTGALLTNMMPGIAALGTALVQGLAGAMAMLPAVIASLIAVFGTLLLAVKGVGGAIGAAWEGDAEAFAQATKNMSKSAADFAKAIASLKPQLLDLRKTVQGRFFEGLAADIKALGTLYIPVLKDKLGEMALGWNIALRSMMSFLNNSVTMRIVEALLHNISAAFQSLAAAFAPVLSMFLDLAEVGSSFLPGIADKLAEMAQNGADFINAMANSGRLTEWFQRMFDALRQVWDLLVQVGGALVAFWDAASTAGGGFLATATEIFRSLNAWLSSMEGRQTLFAMFNGAKEVISALTPIVATLLSALGPMAESLFPALAQGLRILGDAAKPVGTFFGHLAELVAPLLPLLGTTLGAALTVAANMLGLMAQALQPIVGFISALAQRLLPEFMAFLNMGFAEGMRAVQPLLDAFSAALANLLPIVLELGLSLINTLMPTFYQLQPALMATFEALLPLVTEFFRLFGLLGGSLGPIIVQLAQQFAVLLVEAINQLLPLLPELVTQGIEIMRAFVDLAIQMAPLIAEIIRMALESGVLERVVQIVIAAVQSLIGIMILIEGAIRMVIAVVRSVREAWNSAAGAARDLANTIRTGLDAAMQALSIVGDRVRALFAGAGSWLVDAGRNMMEGLANGITSKLGWAVDKARSAASAVVSGFKGALGISSPSKVMAQEVGRWIPPGLIKGVESQVPAMERALAGIVPDLTAALRSGVPSQGAPQAHFAPGSVSLDVSRVRNFAELEALLSGLLQTARASSAATARPMGAMA